MSSRPLWVHGFQLDNPDMDFMPNMDHAGCSICGAVFQSPLDRKTLKSPAEVHTAHTLRQQWRVRHAKQHPQREHDQLKISGRKFTPEAARRLAAFGIIPLSDLVKDEEVASALSDAPRNPVNDSEGPLKCLR